jgi:hypothetical protein
MVINRIRAASIAVAVAVLLAVLLALLPGSDPKAVGEEPKVTESNNFEEIKVTLTVPAGERVRASAACDDGYAVSGMSWRVLAIGSSGEDGASAPGLKVVTKVSRDQAKGRFVAFYPERFFDVFTELSIEGTITCLLLPAVQSY